MSIQVSSFYRFANLTESRVTEIRDQLIELGRQHELRGLVVLATEGINATVSGVASGIEALKEWLRGNAALTPRIFKDSVHPKHPFRRYKVDVRPEIVTFGDSTIRVNEEHNATRLSPQEWHRYLEEHPETFLVDVRNSYEVELGHFKGARDPQTRTFAQFADYVAREQPDKSKPVMMYCTGGIRCEKAAQHMLDHGFTNVIHLDGGILNYMEQIPEGLYQGECFVFDHRVALDSTLQASKTFGLCPHCGNPGAENIECKKCGKAARVCGGCLQQPALHSCSKNCAYHLG